MTSMRILNTVKKIPARIFARFKRMKLRGKEQTGLVEQS